MKLLLIFTVLLFSIAILTSTNPIASGMLTTSMFLAVGVVMAPMGFKWLS